MLSVADIVEGTSVDGPGLRTAIYFAGCSHQCPGCQNPATWNIDAGRLMTIDEILEVIRYNRFDVTFTGGDPLYQADGVTALAREVHLLGFGIWCYTGFTFEQIYDSPEMSPLLALIDVLVDGPFVESQKDLGLRFRGSSNQRLVDCRKSSRNEIVLWE